MVVDEKDRFGEKLRDAERAREEQYFKERDRQLVEQLRRAKDDQVDEKLKEAAHMRCPKCGAHLATSRVHEIAVDECPACHGVWLDKGEVDSIAQRETDGWIARWLRGEFKETT